MKKKIGIYIHIPFCVKKCLYCDFVSYPLEKVGEKEVYIQALFHEMEEYKEILKEYEVDTIFLGGGTPNLLSGQEMRTILDKLRSTISLDENAEISMEMNPGAMQKEWLLDYQKAGINRVSVGLQSACDEELKRLGRIHTYDHFLKTFDLLRICGFNNINVDIMSGLPYQKMENYKATLEKVTRLKPEHISAYSLIVEEGTPFYLAYGDEKGSRALPEEEVEREMYQFTKEFLQREGYERYEFSNYARPGFECRHNLKYWRMEEYLGLGLSAASFLKGFRYLNVSGLGAYCDDSFRTTHREVTKVSKKDEMEEFMFLGLRTIAGVSKKDFLHRFGIEMEEIYAPVIEKYEKLHLLKNGEQVRLSEEGINVSNCIMADFLL